MRPCRAAEAFLQTVAHVYSRGWFAPAERLHSTGPDAAWDWSLIGENEASPSFARRAYPLIPHCGSCWLRDRLRSGRLSP